MSAEAIPEGFRIIAPRTAFVVEKAITLRETVILS
jgi:hypothetical protein